MSAIEIVPAKITHIGPLNNRLRDIDRFECEIMGHSSKKALRDGYFYSEKVWTALKNGEPHAMFGVHIPSALGGVGHPWFLGSEEVYRHGRELLKFGPRYVEMMSDSIPILKNLVSVRNKRAIRLLEVWGFEVQEEITDVNGAEFREFSRCATQEL